LTIEFRGGVLENLIVKAFRFVIRQLSFVTSTKALHSSIVNRNEGFSIRQSSIVNRQSK